MCFALYFIKNQMLFALYFIFCIFAKNITTAKIVDIVGESTNAMTDARRIPSLLELHSVRLDFQLVQKIFYIDR